MHVYDGARLMTLAISTECVTRPTLVGGGLVEAIQADNSMFSGRYCMVEKAEGWLPSG